MAWCGLDSVLLYWDDVLLMVGPFEDSVSYFYDEPVIFIPECDGVRVLPNTSMERSAKAGENLRLISASLPEAVEACIDAAGHEYDVSHQRTLRAMVKPFAGDLDSALISSWLWQKF
ncbi:VACUOLAR PROTEIN SORTING VPS16 [Salix viminalis]|uniref:VACUOLAR PROTEIN SORTING VPS16 n=1 Tax=Salix viminalis TaxID=40686 RepID=A0A9Q0ZDN0_SALVM|nr:VACUOLAR PROTEIN SORTING VPS16 [Salix viminalis]